MWMFVEEDITLLIPVFYDIIIKIRSLDGKVKNVKLIGTEKQKI